ncbi:cytochrome c3 family protein [Candidatus Sulfurimonas baltica]|uniref:Cytochrome c3 family protein n=1 Tax=Candidatus Sulfurimonas baltica TaxID=2740404 RepID=A0A7S7LVA6_9BACT|nr:cytochrome c3 family protein [Candidatus Sulfurimonas baltica]QOY52096.1 cytochrome c3 family protein [Candidatus Sulfurimonas baltica]
MYGASAAGVAGVTMAVTATNAQPTDATLACLGCHDGISAMNSVINAPGSGAGGSNTTGILIGGTLQLPRSMGNLDTNSIGGQGLLTDDHPMSIVYTPGKANLKALNSGLTDFVGATQISELLRGGKVHCVSCHDPHTARSRYLRNENTNSALCLGCHNK